MDYGAGRERDYAIRAQVIPSMHYVEKMLKLRSRAEHSMDFMLERDTSPIEGITRRYPMIVILKPVLTCPQICVYCQRNWEIEDVYSKDAVLTKEKLEKKFNVKVLKTKKVKSYAPKIWHVVYDLKIKKN